MRIERPSVQEILTNLGRWMLRRDWFSGHPKIRYLVFRIAFRCGRLLRFRPQWATTKSGSRMLCDLADPLQAELFYFGSYSGEELRLLIRELRPGDVFLDVGANIGVFSVEIAKHVGPEGMVVSFEPAPDTARVLVENLRMNMVQDTVQLLQVGLGSAYSKVDLHAAKADPLDVGRRSVSGKGDVVAEISLHALDDLIRTGEVTFERGPHAIKLDIEGGEGEAVQGMAELLRRRKPRLILTEVNEDPSLKSEALTDALMEGLGYRRSAELSSRSNVCYRPIDATSEQDRNVR